MRILPALEICLLLFFSQGPAKASGLRVTVELAGSQEPGAKVAGTVSLTPLGRDTGAGPLRSDMALPGGHTFQAQDKVAWEVSVRAEGYWAEPKTVPAGAREPEVRLRLVPTGILQGRLVPSPGQTSSATLEARFQTAADRPGADSFQGTVSCPVDEGLAKCEVPAGRLDLRLRSAAHVPIYFWGIETRAGRSTDLGDLRLQPGASVSGWIKTSEDGFPSAECKVELAAETTGNPESLWVEERLRRTAQETRPNERGFFQLAGVAPGRYMLRVTQPGYSPVSVAAIEVREGLEAQVVEPIHLAKPVTFELALDPATEPYGHPWQVRLMRRSSPSDPPAETFQAQARREGVCSIPNVPAGAYELIVLGGDRSIWHREMVDVTPGLPTHMVHLPVLRIDGLVTRGGEPLASTVWLGREGRRLRFDSDGEGRFQGLLPEEGTWSVALASMEEGWRVSLPSVEIKVPKGKNTARVEINVPDTTLEGEVVDEAGAPVPGAQVSAFSKAQIDSRVRTDEKGEFAIRGLPAGAVMLSASERDRESGWVHTGLTEGQSSPWLRLVVRRLKKARGRVLSPAGGLPGATLLAWPASQPASRVTSAMSGPGGDFELEVPAGEALLQLLVLPPGFAFQVASVRIDSVQPFEIEVEPYGGTLVLDLGSSSAAQPLLVHEGIAVPLQPLQDWARLQGQPPTEPGRLVIPNVTSGAYSLCKGNAQQATCSRGFLSPLGELFLRAPD